jgi:hypothetical protein
MTVQTRRPPEADNSLALLFLASVAHPDAELRRRVAGQLEDHIEAAGPWHQPDEVRRFLLEQTGTPLEPFALDPPALELAVRLVRLAFCRRAAESKLHSVRLVSSRTIGEDGGLLVFTRGKDRQLRGRYLKRLAYDKRRQRQTPVDPFHLVAPAMTPRLRELQAQRRAVQATCRARNGYRLTLAGDLPWGPSQTAADFARQRQVGLEAAGLKAELGKKNDVIISTTTPESIIRFSASLARGELLTLRGGAHPGTSGRVVVALRDFEGAKADFAAVAGYGTREDWLCAPPVPRLEVSVEDRIAIAHWLYLPDAWVDEAVLRSLL